MSDLHDPVSSLEDDLLVSGWVVLRDDVGTLILNTVDNCEGRREGGGRRGERGRRRKGRKGGGEEGRGGREGGIDNCYPLYSKYSRFNLLPAHKEYDMSH